MAQDDRVDETQFKELVSRWFTPKFQNTCSTKRSSRSKTKEPHVAGSKLFARLAHEVAMENDAVYPTRGELYIATRTRKDGTIVDEKAASVVGTLKAIASDPTNTPEDLDDFTNDDYSKVKRPEKRGYVRIVGRKLIAKDHGGVMSNPQLIQLENATQLQNATQTINRLEKGVDRKMNLIQQHIPNAGVSILFDDLDVEVTQIRSSTTNNFIK